MSVPRIVVIGAGFGGVYVTRRLAPLARSGKIELTVIDRSNYFLFTPLLHEVATGGLSPLSVMEPLREIFAGDPVRVVKGDVARIDCDSRTVTTAQGTTVPYDTLVVSTGAGTDYRKIPGADAHSLPLKTTADALRIRETVINAFDDACNMADETLRDAALSFAVVGGGATGTELVAELQEFVHGIVERYHRRSTVGALRPTVTLIHAGPDLLPQFHPSLRQAAAGHLRDIGVDVRLNVFVREVTAEGIVFSDDSVLAAKTVLWTAGVAAQAPSFTGSATPTVANGRIAVDSTLAAVGTAGMYALGDVAHALDAAGKPYPLLAQVAVAQADVVARNIAAEVEGSTARETFVYHSKGSLVSLGQWYAVGEIFSAHLRGRMAWWVWRTVYLFKFLSWRKRMRIALEWTVGLFTPRDIGNVR